MASGIARGRGDDDDGVAQHGGHNPKYKDMQPWLSTVYLSDIGHPCYDQLTPVKTSYLLTGIT